MSTFLNINFDRKINLNLAVRHFFFSLFWILSLLLFVFRLDLILLENTQYANLLPYIPLAYIGLVLTFLAFNPWYYILAFFLYPILLIFWFIPKSILTVGKIYMFGNYVNSVVSWFQNLKFSIFNLVLLVFTMTVFFVENKAAMFFVICSISYFYLKYLIKLLRKSFQPPSIFGSSLEDSITSLVAKKSSSDFLLKSFIFNKEDEKLEIEVRREKQIKKVLMFNFCADLLKQRIIGHRGKQAYMISWLFGSFMFLIYSILFFSFLNFQLFQIDSTSFIYAGKYEVFDFFYYTLKTITFGDIELIKPISILARVIEISCFFVIGIFILIIFLSIILSMKQERLNENLKLTTQLIDSEYQNIQKHVEEELGANIIALAKEVKNIDDSLRNLKNFIDRLF